jgi:methylenetetrahydrofolate reductase (NADPH)
MWQLRSEETPLHAGDRGVEADTAPAPGSRNQGALPVCSIELSAYDRATVVAAAAVLPPGMNVYLPKLPKRQHADVLDQVRMLHELGLRPVPHIAARNLASVLELDEFAGHLARESGVDRVLVIGGDDRNGAGPFRDSAAVLASGILEAHGIRRVDVAGYPGGHPSIPEDVLHADLRRKVDLARAQSIELTVVAQFSFQPEGIADYCTEIAAIAPGVAVHAGVVGPISARKLLQFARICGVGNSLRAVEKLGLDSLRLVTQADPAMQSRTLLRRLRQGRAGNLTGIHLFTFGNFAESAAWARHYSLRGQSGADAGAEA